MKIVQRLLALAGIGVVAWACLTSWGAVVHGHPLYAVLLVNILHVKIMLSLKRFACPLATF